MTTTPDEFVPGLLVDGAGGVTRRGAPDERRRIVPVVVLAATDGCVPRGTRAAGPPAPVTIPLEAVDGHVATVAAEPGSGRAEVRVEGEPGWLAAGGSAEGAGAAGGGDDPPMEGRAVASDGGPALCMRAGLSGDAGGGHAQDGWPRSTGDPSGSRTSHDGSSLRPRDGGRGLVESLRFRAPTGPVYGTPAIAGERVHAADGGGSVFALEGGTGAPAWVSRVASAAITSSVLVASELVVVGDHTGIVHALDRVVGTPVWSTRPNGDSYPPIWGSPISPSVVRGDTRRDAVLAPVESDEEIVAVTEAQPCCTSRNSAARIDAMTNAVPPAALHATGNRRARIEPHDPQDIAAPMKEQTDQ